MASDRLHIALCQINLIVGDLEGNVERMRERYCQLAGSHDLVVFPELAVIGYPIEDLVLVPGFQERAAEAMQPLIEATKRFPAALLVGNLLREDGNLYNAAFLIEGGEIKRTVRKHFLPNTGVFDEVRVFVSGPMPEPVLWRGRSLGLLICEDMWHPEVFPRLARQQCDLVIVINGSPFEAEKQYIRERLACEAATRHRLMVLYCNMVGGQDELIFDGMSFALNCSGELVHRSPAFLEDVVSLSVGRSSLTSHGGICPVPERIESLYGAMVLGLRDYVAKNGFSGVLLGLSGGIDSALAAAIAVDALGASHVRCLMLASPYTSPMSHEDAAAIAGRLGTHYDTLSIEPGMSAIETMLQPLSGEGVPGELARENIQSRLRAVTLMAISNSTGDLLITTGNKSEMAVGYATLYGDMCGAFNPLKDVYKTDVYALARWRNAHTLPDGRGPRGEMIPERVIERAPSAELRENQTDQDSLPPYDRLDAILRGLVEDQLTVEDIFKKGYARQEVEKVARLLYVSEYKRRQAPPGPKLTSMSFGRDRRFPITNRFKL